MSIQIRRAEKADQTAILAISAQIWGGTDYVPYVIEKWMQPELGILWVAECNGDVAGFSRMTFLSGNRCWLEGIRVDPAMRGKGVGKALTHFQMTESRRMGFKACALSSYCENYESLNIVRQHGFEETAKFKFFDGTLPPEAERTEDWHTGDKVCTAHRQALLAFCEIVPLKQEDWSEALEAVLASSELLVRGGYLSYDWTFEPATPEFLQARLAAGDFYRLTKQGKTTVFSLSAYHAKGVYHTLNFVQNPELELEAAAYAFEHMHRQGESAVSYMASNGEKCQAFKALGYDIFNEEDTDVFVFERKEQEA